MMLYISKPFVTVLMDNCSKTDSCKVYSSLMWNTQHESSTLRKIILRVFLINGSPLKMPEHPSTLPIVNIYKFSLIKSPKIICLSFWARTDSRITPKTPNKILAERYAHIQKIAQQVPVKLVKSITIFRSI